MSYTIEKKIIPGLPNRPLIQTRYVVAHEAGNPNNTGPDSLDREVATMTKNWRAAYTGFFVGSGGRIVQLAPSGRMQGGAGPNANPYAYTHVELARTKNPETFRKDYAAYIWLLRKCAKEAGLPLTLDAGTSPKSKGIKTHEWIAKHVKGTTHVDPYGYLASFGVSRAQFKRDVETGVPFAGQAIQAGASAGGAAWDERYGGTGPRVKELQKNLNTLGYKVAEDGSFGAATRDAVVKFQKDHKLAADGIYGPACQVAMRQALAAKKPAASAAWDVRFGETGGHVGDVQKILQGLGYYKGALDNSYGPAMLEAVKAFQRDHKLTQDGIFGPGSQEAAKKAQTAKPKAESVFRVLEDGKQVGAFQEQKNVLDQVGQSIKKGAKNVTIQKK